MRAGDHLRVCALLGRPISPHTERVRHRPPPRVAQRSRARHYHPRLAFADSPPCIQCALELTAVRVEFRHERLGPQPRVRLGSPEPERARHVLVQQSAQRAAHHASSLTTLGRELSPASPRASERARPPGAKNSLEHEDGLEALLGQLSPGAPRACERALPPRDQHAPEPVDGLKILLGEPPPAAPRARELAQVPRDQQASVRAEGQTDGALECPGAQCTRCLAMNLTMLHALRECADRALKGPGMPRARERAKLP